MQGKYLALLVFLFSIFCLAQSRGTDPTLGTAGTPIGMTHEEAVVRAAYARLMFAVQVNEVHQAINEAQTAHKTLEPEALIRRIRNSELKVALGDFKVGNVTDAEIAPMRYDELVTKPSGDILDISHGMTSFSRDQESGPKRTESVIAHAQWHQAQSISEDWTQKWSVIFPHIENSSWFNRYAAFRATVSFGGRSREYQAMFLFGRTPTGEDYIVPVDTVSGLTGAVEFFIHHDVYPEALIEGQVGNQFKAVRDWLASQAVTGETHKDNCNLVTLRCGISQEDLKKISAHSTRLHQPAPSQRFSVPHRVEAGFHLPTATLFPMLQADCSNFSTSNAHFGSISDSGRHNTGNHTMNDIASTSCTYSSGASANCDTVCQVNVSQAGIGDNGSVTGFCHVTNKAVKNDQQNGTGAGASCGGGVGGGVKECFACACSVSVSVSSNGASVSISSDGFYTFNDGLGQTCATEPDPTAGGGGSDCTTSDLQCLGSPIILDLSGKGFDLTDAGNGVRFDISGSGQPVQIAWTAPGADNGFLVLDRNGNGTIDNGTELFGQFTPQPPSARPNGFLALAAYDKPENGGNGDGVIDSRDAVFEKLRIWVDLNHDGISQPNELFRLPDVGVYSINLNYLFSEREDRWGNVFRYRADVNGEPGQKDSVGKVAYDVFLVMAH